MFNDTGRPAEISRDATTTTTTTTAWMRENDEREEVSGRCEIVVKNLLNCEDARLV